MDWTSGHCLQGVVDQRISYQVGPNFVGVCVYVGRSFDFKFGRVE